MDRQLAFLCMEKQEKTEFIFWDTKLVLTLSTQISLCPFIKCCLSTNYFCGLQLCALLCSIYSFTNILTNRQRKAQVNRYICTLKNNKNLTFLALSAVDQIKNRRRNLVSAKVGLVSLGINIIFLPVIAIAFSAPIELGKNMK